MNTIAPRYKSQGLAERSALKLYLTEPHEPYYCKVCHGWHLRAMRGKPKSIEHREKISRSMKGRPSHFKGRTYEEIYGIDRAMDRKRKMSESMKS